jgi:N-acetylglutamate synthase-like GNAT family acetyltransferase
MNNNILCLDLSKFIFDSSKYKTPYLYETWTWEGDESVLPFKWVDLVRSSDLLKEKYNFEKVKLLLKEKYFSKKNFDKKSFFFITYRSECSGCCYMDTNNNNKIDYFLVNNKHKEKKVEYGLFNLIYNRAKELNINKIYIDLNLTNINRNFFEEIGFK